MGSLMLLGAAAVLCGFWWSGRAQQRAQDQVQAKAKQATPPRVPGSAPGAQALQIKIPLPEYSLTDQHGKPFGSQDLAGKVYVADFIFTRCSGICLKMSRCMADLQRKLPQLQLISITADPDYDTPTVLRKYARDYGASSRWHFLSGKWLQIKQLAQHGFKMSVLSAEESEDGLITHGERLILVDRAGNIRGFFQSNNDRSVAQLIARARALLAEK